ncbi:MAG: hypothetical protein IKW74_03070, partial [Thermoguttaceae bacterium]|nr:hypothetical protein [Thermoguttaceae bacterium]
MLKKAERTFTFTSSGGYRTGFGRLYTANFPEKTGLNKKLRIPFFCILTGFIFFSFVINMGYSVSYGQNEVKSVQDTRMTKKVYYPRNCDAGSLGNRLVNFLPGDIRARTEWSVDSTKKALTIIGPEQAITIADQLIPRMDASVQLVDRHVDVGVIDKPVPEKPVLSNADAALLQGERDVSPRYYDPDKNQYVRVAYQADNAVMPDNNEQPLFGSGQSGNLNYENGSGNRIASQFGMNIGAVDPENEDVPDIQAYACPI